MLYACLITGCATLRTRTPPGVVPRSVPWWACPCSASAVGAASIACPSW